MTKKAEYLIPLKGREIMNTVKCNNQNFGDERLLWPGDFKHQSGFTEAVCTAVQMYGEAMSSLFSLTDSDLA